MNIGAIVYKFFIVFLVVFYALNITSIELPVDSVQKAVFLLVFSGLVLFHQNILGFFMIPINFLSQWLTITLLSAITLIITESFLNIGLKIQGLTFNTLSNDLITINNANLSSYGTIAIASALIGFVYAMLNWLREF